MSMTIKKGKDTVFGDCRVAFADITLDNSYPTGGYDLKPTDLGQSDVYTFQSLSATGSGGYVLSFNYSTGKLQAYVAPTSGGGALVQVTPATNLSTVTARITAILAA